MAFTSSCAQCEDGDSLEHGPTDEVMLSYA